MILTQLFVAQLPDPEEELSASASSIWETTLEALPRVGVAVAVVVAFWLIGRILRWSLRKAWRRSRTESFATVMSKIVGWAVSLVGVLIAVTIVFPSVAIVDILAGLGFFSVAIGFAFQDILENLLAGVLILIREPFHGGDQIEVGDVKGTVDRITIRETRVKTFDGQLVLVPNADIYTNPITVITAFESRRTSFVVGVGYDSDLSETRRTILEALRTVEGVSESPEPQALVRELAASTINLDVRFWTVPDQGETLAVLDRAVDAVKAALDDAGIEMPSDMLALQGTDSLVAALKGEAVSAGGSVG